MNLQLANFEDLLATYYHGTAAHQAAKLLGDLIRDRQHLQLATLLRDYRKRAINSPREIALRAATDRLMNCCSMMEIASMTSFVPGLNRTDFGVEIRPILENKHVRLYYEKYYPTKLPQLFRCRLASINRAVNTIDCPGSINSLMVFLDLDRRFMEKLDDGYLLRMLDSFSIEGYWFSDVVELIGQPEEFINHLLLAPKDRDARSWAVTEFSLFMQFCFDLRQLLSTVESQPLLQSAFWNHYSYWFNIIGKELSEQLGDALSRFLAWKPVGGDKAVVKVVQSYVREARAVLRDLMSRKFMGPVDALLKKISR